MQQATTDGLRAATNEERRCVITCVHNGNEDLVRTLFNMWSTKTPPEALKILAGKDVYVTNQSDKEQQLPKLRLVNDQVRAVMTQQPMGRHAQIAASPGESPSTPVRQGAGSAKRRLTPMTPLSEDWSMGSPTPPALFEQVTGLSESMASLSLSSQKQLAELSKAHSAEMAKMGQELASLSAQHTTAMLKMAELLAQKDVVPQWDKR